MAQQSKRTVEQLSSRVIAACTEVQRELGVHCMEIDYQRALEIALPQFGIKFQREVEIPIEYAGVILANRRVDFKCWDRHEELLLETKAAATLRPENVEQALMYVTKGHQKLVLLVNFGEEPLGSRRLVNPKEEWKERFIAALRDCGIVEEACEAAGVNKGTAYYARRRSESFASKWYDALREAMLRVGTGRRLPGLPRGQWQDKFIEALRRTGKVEEACRAANISKPAAYHARRQSMMKPPSSVLTLTFVQRWDEAIREAVERGVPVEPCESGNGKRKQRPRLPHGSWHDKFFAELRVWGIVSQAARAAHIHPNTAHAARRQALRMPIESDDLENDASTGLTRRFAERWDEAIDEAVERMEREAIRRGAEGYDQPVFYRGRRVGKIKRYSDTLLMFLLRANRPEKYPVNSNQ